MVFLWNWVPNRKERKELDAVIKPANGQERKALRQFGKAASKGALSLAMSEYSRNALEKALVETALPSARKGVKVRVYLSPYVPPGLKLDGKMFPALSTLLLVSGTKSYGGQDMLLQVNYGNGKLTVEMPSMVPLSVLENRLVKSAAGVLSGKVELTPRNHTKLTLQSEKA